MQQALSKDTNVPLIMPAFEFQQDLDKLVQNVDALTVSKDLTTVNSARSISMNTA